VGDYIGGWQAMERAVKDGKVRSLGLSNFPEKQIREIVARAEIRPAVVQMEAHPYYPQAALKEYLKGMGAVLMAWFPLGHGDKALLRENVFAKLAAKYGKSAAQVVLRWNTQRGVVVIPKSVHKNRMEQNIDIFDFTLTDDEMKQIAELDLGHSEIVNHFDAGFVKMLHSWKIHA
jgi:diketogulonate reductase-like aldo/keto reductase